MDLDAIHRALAAQIDAYVTDDWNVQAFPFSGYGPPRVEVWPGSPYAGYFVSFGANGRADVMLEVRAYIDGSDAETVFKRVTRALSVGSAHGSSLVDAIMSDRTIDGTVEDVKAMQAEWQPNGDGLSGVVVIPVEIVVLKSGAQV